MADKGTIIVLNGPSSSGKSTVCRAAQSCLADGYLHLSVDDIISSLPPTYLSGHWNPSGTTQVMFRLLKAIGLVPRRYQSLLDTPPSDKAQVWARMIIGFYHAVVTLAERGNNLLVDTVITDRPTYELCADILSAQPAYFVGVHCRPEVLRSRERLRPSRQRGLAEKQAGIVHFDDIYDLRLNTDNLSVTECSLAIRDLVKDGREPLAFKRISGRHGGA